MARTGRMWQKFDEAFGHMDRAFETMDESFAASNDVFNEMNAMPLEAGYHHIRFTATTKTDRWRLFRRFIKLALSSLFLGTAEFRFVNKQPKP